MRVTLSIMAICFAVLVVQALFPLATVLMALTPVLAFGGMYWQFFTYMFAHASISHFGFNMLGLFIFGITVERFLGTKRYILLYILSGAGSGLFHILVTTLSAGSLSDIPMLGASGAVFAVLTAYAIKFPEAKVMIFPIIVPVKAVYAIAGFVLFSIFAGFTDIMSGVAHFGHLGGILFGAIFMLYWRWKDSKSGKGAEDFEWVWDTY